MYQDFDSIIVYYKGMIVWFGELAWIAKEHSLNEQPDISDKWKVYYRIS